MSLPSLQLDDLPSFAFTVVAFLEGDDVLALRCTSKRVKGLVDNEADAIWTTFLRGDFGYDGRQALKIQRRRQGPSVFGTTGYQAVMDLSSAFETWKQWKRASWRYSGGQSEVLLKASYFLRAAKSWARLEKWCLLQGSFGSNMQDSLVPGSSRQDLQWPDEAMSRSTLHATQAILSFYGGQRNLSREPWRGLFGGFSAYRFVTSTMFAGGEWTGGAVVIGVCPISRPKKRLIVRPETGRLEYISMRSTQQACLSAGEDDVLDWFNEYTMRLESGFYQVGSILGQASVHGDNNAILHYPQTIGRGATRTVTRGIEVVASAVYSPFTKSMGFAFVYSIRIRLLEPNDDGYDENRGFESCQLKSRHWRLLNQEGRTEHVDGDGLVGFYPLLREGSHRADSGGSSTSVMAGQGVPSGTFVYESCTSDSETRFGGYMLFVPGSLAEPTGPAFQVHLDSFPLDTNPEYMY